MAVTLITDDTKRVWIAAWKCHNDYWLEIARFMSESDCEHYCKLMNDNLGNTRVQHDEEYRPIRLDLFKNVVTG